MENRIPPPLVVALFGLFAWLAARNLPGTLAHASDCIRCFFPATSKIGVIVIPKHEGPHFLQTMNPRCPGA